HGAGYAEFLERFQDLNPKVRKEAAGERLLLTCSFFDEVDEHFSAKKKDFEGIKVNMSYSN
ncbi:MAG: hypothetical protein IKN33_00750, partial [Selenomonadaceae bacterium]|nr:hypothetical protein [Selenomonadaceae bacterium]